MCYAVLKTNQCVKETCCICTESSYTVTKASSTSLLLHYVLTRFKLIMKLTTCCYGSVQRENQFS